MLHKSGAQKFLKKLRKSLVLHDSFLSETVSVPMFFVKRSIQMSGAPFSYALLQGVALRHLVHILTHVGDVAIIGIGVSE